MRVIPEVRVFVYVYEFESFSQYSSPYSIEPEVEGVVMIVEDDYLLFLSFLRMQESSFSDSAFPLNPQSTDTIIFYNSDKIPESFARTENAIFYLLEYDIFAEYYIIDCAIHDPRDGEGRGMLII